MPSTPIISIVVTCYNQAPFIDEALNSVLEQTYQNWECIIVNDGSTDHTEEVILKWLKKDIRFQYIASVNKGVSNARNIGIEKALGTYILPLDGDDIFGTRYVELGISEFNKHPDLKVVYCKAKKFGTETGYWVLPVFSMEKLRYVNMIFCSAIFKKEDWNAICGYDTNMTHGLEDWEFWIALLKNGGEVKQLDYVGFFYRIKERSRQADLSIDSNKNEMMCAYISKKHADIYIDDFGSFQKIHKDYANLKKSYNKLSKDKRAIANLFFNTFFGFKIFKEK
ncbi:glycosyltransferase family 2 protein [Winogradskyella schleiferi]|uniref:glycosyltransferase family 2 protein n=1 Tax=Winogradskyella schleiferi TaxID=2686078 RepID=UPI0015BF1D9D|nr:glycosyltransferase family A protein [Winogradskyella schleiferi]